MVLAEPYPTPPPGIPGMVTNYLTGLIPAGVIDGGIAALFAAVTLILAALAHNHARRQTWLGGWVSGPVSVITALIAANYGASGLPDLAGVDPFARDPQTLVIDVAVALLAGALVAVVAWPVAARYAARCGRPTSLAALREQARTQPLHAGGAAAAGAVAGWIALGPLLSVAGAVIGFLITATVEHLRGPAVPEHLRRPPVPPHAPVPPAVSDEGW